MFHPTATESDVDDRETTAHVRYFFETCPEPGTRYADLLGFVGRTDQLEAAANFPERDDLPADTHAQLGPCFLQALQLPAQPLLIDVFTLGLHQPAGHEFGVVIEDPANVRLGLLP